MKARWIVLIAAGLIVVAVWAAVAHFFFDPSLALWTALVTACALSLEGFLCACAAVLGWSFLASRRERLARLKQRLFGG